MKIKTFTRRFIFILIMLSVSGKGAGVYAASPQAESKWARYLARGEEFSVLLPEAPSIALKSRPNKKINERYEGRIYGAYGDGIVYLIISENNPKRSEKMETFVEEFRKTLPRHQSLGSSELSFDRDINLNNFSGKRYFVKFYNGAKGVVDFYMTNKHVYIVEAAGGDESNPSIRQFFGSLSLDENVTGKKDSTKDILSIASVTAPTGLQSSANQVTGQIFSPKEVTQKAFAVSRPEPFYTEEARRKQLTGTVVLKAVLSSSGKVANIEVLKELGNGLTEKALEAAGKMKFIPAMKDGKFVSQYIQIEYNFNLY